jgi:hypothetical protein
VTAIPAPKDAEMTLPARSRLTSLLAVVGTAASSLVLSTVAATVLAAPAHANPAGPHDPFGHVDKIVANSDGSYTATGWAADPDALSANARVVNVVDGIRRHSAVTSIARPDIAKKYGTGPTAGFSITSRLNTATHRLCFAVYNVGQGLSTILKCITTPSGTAVDTSGSSPQGAVTWTGATASTMTVQGHVSDPDFLSRRLTVVLYVDGSPAKTVNSTWTRSPAGAEVNWFSITVPVQSGAHLGCVWVVNVGFGSNSSFGCNAIDTRGAPGTGKVATPKANSTVVTIAKRQIGKPYVWAAAGPKAFDCSGLVVYSYAKAGITGIYHQSGVQFNDARLIPASRAVPGDLVFYHDSVGSVYHVGIYLAPGKTVAAIDESEGVNYQSIWDPSSATYGSFTHT